MPDHAPIIAGCPGRPESQLSSPGHWKLNSRAALKHIDIGGVDAELAVWGRNLTDKRYAYSILYTPFGQSANYDPARTYGVDLTIEF